MFNVVNTFKLVFKASLSHYWTDAGFSSVTTGVSNSWEWWNSGGFVWPGMTDDSALKIGHCPPLSFIMSVGQVWWREPGSWERRSFIQNERLCRARRRSAPSPTAEELLQNLIRAWLAYAVAIIRVDCEEPTVMLWTKTSRVISGISSKYEDELTRDCICIEFGVLLLKNVSASVA